MAVPRASHLSRCLRSVGAHDRRRAQTKSDSARGQGARERRDARDRRERVTKEWIERDLGGAGIGGRIRILDAADVCREHEWRSIARSAVRRQSSLARAAESFAVMAASMRAVRSASCACSAQSRRTSSCSMARWRETVDLAHRENRVRARARDRRWRRERMASRPCGRAAREAASDRARACLPGRV